MGTRKQLSSPIDDHSGKVLPEGHHILITSAGFTLRFHGPAERDAYKHNPANATQLGKNEGEGDVRGR